MDQTSPAPPYPPEAHRPRRRLVREPEDRRIAGVCGGIADAVGVDSSVVRLVAVVLAFITPIVLVAYLVLSVALPERQPDEPRVQADGRSLARIPHPAIVIGAVVVVASRIDDAWWLEPFPAAVALVGVGVWLLVRNQDEDEPLPAAPPPPAGTSMFGTTPPGPVDAPPRDADPGDTRPDDAGSLNGTTLTHPLAGAPWAPASGEGHGEGDGGDEHEGPNTAPRPSYGAWWEPRSEPAEDSAAVPPLPVAPPLMRRSRLGRGMLALLLVGAGGLWLATSLDLFTIDGTDALALGLLAVGVTLVVATWWGRAYALVPVGVALAAALVMTEVVDIPVNAGIGDRTESIAGADEMAADHELLAGDLTLDLTDADLTASDLPTVEADLGAGDLVVVVPHGVAVEAHATSRAGEFLAPDDGGTVDDGDIGFDGTYTLDGEPGGGRVELDLSVGFGDVVVNRAGAASPADSTTPTTAADPAGARDREAGR